MVEKWQRGHQKAALKAAAERMMENAVVPTLEAVHARLMTHGIAVMNGMKDIFHPRCVPSVEQRDFIHSLPDNCTELLFEGCTFTDSKPDFEPYKDKHSGHASCL